MSPQTNQSSPFLPQKLWRFALVCFPLESGPLRKMYTEIYSRRSQKIAKSNQTATQQSTLALQKAVILNVGHAWLIRKWSNCYVWLMYSWKPHQISGNLRGIFQRNKQARKEHSRRYIESRGKGEEGLGTQVRSQNNPTPKGYFPLTQDPGNSGFLFKCVSLPLCPYHHAQ